MGVLNKLNALIEVLVMTFAEIVKEFSNIVGGHCWYGGVCVKCRELQPIIGNAALTRCADYASYFDIPARDVLPVDWNSYRSKANE